MILFVDSDIILDLLLNRQAFAEAAEKFFSLARLKKYTLFASSNSLANIYYILNDINKHKDAKKILQKLRKFIEVAAVDADTVDFALNSDFKDFEDALQSFAAKKVNAKFIVTRNKKDYKLSPIPAITAEEMFPLL